MKSLPSIIIVADRGKLVAYRTTETNSLQAIDRTSFSEGNSKISETVSDQSGAFPIPGGVGTGAYESMPMIAELEVRSFRKIRAKIGEILAAEKPGGWGFAAPSEINAAILDELDKDWKKNLRINLPLDLTNTPTQAVAKAFQSPG
ncbi:host attachment protein [Luteolibacter yonseiensis]|uniref:Host attachment protein n=1 Tax=Luteolibacter yonseiensis TaxID=1144680 RepID=A0A934RA74_9BACT|nr:host attachment protein [Luteolibacter yonseiensis]MBK1818005.1 host attachment protein [Luteolibacter yonseiensis]